MKRITKIYLRKERYVGKLLWLFNCETILDDNPQVYSDLCKHVRIKEIIYIVPEPGRRGVSRLCILSVKVKLPFPIALRLLEFDVTLHIFLE